MFILDKKLTHCPPLWSLFKFSLKIWNSHFICTILKKPNEQISRKVTSLILGLKMAFNSILGIMWIFAKNSKPQLFICCLMSVTKYNLGKIEWTDLETSPKILILRPKRPHLTHFAHKKSFPRKMGPFTFAKNGAKMSQSWEIWNSTFKQSF